MKIKFLSLEIALLLSIAGAFAQNGATESITWNYNSGLLTIGGIGAMPDFDVEQYGETTWATSAPWGKYYDSITAVVIKQGVTGIGTFAFFGCMVLDSVDIAGSVTKIGINAFTRCYSLKSVVLPHGVTTIDNSAFNSCGLISITLPNSITSIGLRVFGTTHLSSITNLNPIPLNIDPLVFYDVNISTCTLQVPIGSVSAYRHAEVWKEFNIVGIEVGLEELPAKAGGGELLVYPNPATGTCSITMPDEFLYERSLTLSVYDAAGRLVQQMVLDNEAETPQLRLGLEAKGVYLVVLSNGRKEYKGKVVFN